MHIIRKIILSGMILMSVLVISAWSYAINDTSVGVLNGSAVGGPDPSSIALLGFGLVGLFWARRQK